MNTKNKEMNNELKSIKLLEFLGFVCLKLKSNQAFNIVAVKNSDVVFIRVLNRIPTSIETESLRRFESPSNCRKAIHIWKHGTKAPEIKEV